MKASNRRLLLLASAGSLLSTAATAQVTIISDDFEVDSSANYTVIDDTTPDGAQDWAFDYVAAGIPLAPRSAPGDTKALKLTANLSGNDVDAWTINHNTLVSEDRYTVNVDVWMNYIGVTATTEFAHVGVGGDATTFNSVFTPISGSGAFLSFSGDGGVVSDHRWFRDAANTPPGDMFNTTLPNDHPSYLGNGSNNTGPFFQNLFPSPPSTVAGSPGNIWTTVTIDVDNVNGQISFYYDGQLTFQGDFANRFDGACSMGIKDAFQSLGLPESFTLFDNFEVSTPPSGFGTAYCAVNNNSTGAAAVLTASGSIAVANNNVTLQVDQMPLAAFGYFLTSPFQGFTPNPNMSSGNLCLSGSIGRYVGPGEIQNSGTTGSISLAINLVAMPTPTGPISAMVGDTWNFQAWFRDTDGMGGLTSNFSNGLEVVFQ